jgi:hypothetical protein
MSIDLDALVSEVGRLKREVDGCVTTIESLRAERDHFRAAWATAQVRLDCGADAAEAVREERAAVVAWLEKAGWMPSMVEVFRRGEHRRREGP